MTGAAAVELPFPPSTLSPNARLHWAALQRAKRGYKAECLGVAGCKRVWKLPTEGMIPLVITISPPDNRPRDRDNMQASLKYGLDHIARIHRVDDCRFDPSYVFTDPVPGGRVIVEVGA